jgi:hypothetical protein
VHNKLGARLEQHDPSTHIADEFQVSPSGDTSTSFGGWQRHTLPAVGPHGVIVYDGDGSGSGSPVTGIEVKAKESTSASNQYMALEEIE